MAPLLRKLAGFPLKMIGDVFQPSAVPGEVARALPDSKGGEEPKDLQRWRTDMYEMFTTTLGESVMFYAADQWVRVQFLLETAGPVAIGTRAEIVPVLSGKGRLLTTDIPYEVYVPKGSRLYYASENVNRVAVTVEPIPWQEQLAMEIRRVAGATLAGAKEVASAIIGRPPGLQHKPFTAPPTKLQRLTPMGKPGRML